MGKPSIAFRIAKPYIAEDKRCITMDFPMLSLSTDRETLDARWQENADAIHAILERGESAVFLTLGDPMVYLT